MEPVQCHLYRTSVCNPLYVVPSASPLHENILLSNDLLRITIANVSVLYIKHTRRGHAPPAQSLLEGWALLDQSRKVPGMV